VFSRSEDDLHQEAGDEDTSPLFSMAPQTIAGIKLLIRQGHSIDKVVADIRKSTGLSHEDTELIIMEVRKMVNAEDSNIS